MTPAPRARYRRHIVANWGVIMSEPLPRRLVFCFDGPWNRLSAAHPTNVSKLAQMVVPTAHDGTPQIVYYDEGIGTHTDRIRQILEGAFGWGMLAIIREAYRFLIFNYQPGDQLYAFGFSRGAYTARSFLGFVRHAGILDVINARQIEEAIEIYKTVPAGQTGQESERAKEFRLRNSKGVCVSEEDLEYRRANDPEFDPHNPPPLLDIRYLGVWDTVSALGLPAFLPGAKGFNAKYNFHDAVLTSKIKAARHAVAIDEKRKAFPVTLFGKDKIDELNERARAAGKTFESWERPYLEQWFPGVHSAVGGGVSPGLSDCALLWVLTGARRAGLQLRADDDARTFAIAPNPFDRLGEEAGKGPVDWLRRRFHAWRSGPDSGEALALATYQRWRAAKADLAEGLDYRPGTLHLVADALHDWEHAACGEPKPDAAYRIEEYIVAKGDSLSRIAQARLGAADRYPEIFALNRDRIEDPNYISIGQRLRVPVPVAPAPDGSSASPA